MSSAMNRSFRFRTAYVRAIISVLLIAPVLLGGCSSVRLGYSQAPNLIYWWINGYVSLNEAQSTRLSRELNSWYDWHRRSQLPDYAALLARARLEAQEPVTGAQMCRWRGLVAQRLELAYDRFSPALAELAVSLSSEQMDRLERRLSGAHDELTQQWTQVGDAAGQPSLATRRVERIAKDLLGSLSEAQRSLISKTVANDPVSTDMWLQERLERQQELVRGLKRLRSHQGTNTSPAASESMDRARAHLRTFATSWQRSPREPYRALQQRSIRQRCQLAADLLNISNPQQRQSLQNKLKSWEEVALSMAVTTP